MRFLLENTPILIAKSDLVTQIFNHPKLYTVYCQANNCRRSNFFHIKIDAFFKRIVIVSIVAQECEKARAPSMNNEYILFLTRD